VATDQPFLAGVAGRYASALFDLAGEENKHAEVEADLAKFSRLLDESDDLRRLTRSPVISVREQASALAKLLEKAGFGALTSNFLMLLARNRRLFVVSDVIAAFRALAAMSRGETTAEVTSAVTLNEAQLTTLKDTLKASIGKDVQLSAKVDPTLIGGLVVKVGSRMIDSSLRTKLAGLKSALKEAG